MGERAQKFNRNGSYADIELGGGGTPLPAENELGLTDITIDAQGNAWVVGPPRLIAVYDPDGNLLKTLESPDGDEFDRPGGLAFDSQGNIYIADGGNHRVQIFSSAEQYLYTIGVTGEPGQDNDHLYGPWRLAIDDQDRLYVADMNNNRIQIFDVTDPLSPTYQATIGVPDECGEDNGHLCTPTGVAVDESRIYVADSYNKRVQIFDRQSRAYIASIPTDCQGFPEAFCTDDVAVDADGYLYVSEPKRARVQQYDRYLNLVRTFGVTDVHYPVDGDHFVEISSLASSPDGGLLVMTPFGSPQLIKLDADGDLEWTLEAGEWPEEFKTFYLCIRHCPPDDVTTDAAGNIYLAYSYIRIYHPDGTYWTSIGTANNPGSGEYQFDRPDGVAVTPGGMVFVADSGNHRVQIYDSNLDYWDTLGETGSPGDDHAHFNTPVDVVFDSAGNLYVSDFGNERVEVFDASLSYVRTLGPFEGYIDLPLAVDAQDRLYVADGNGQVHVFDPMGEFLTSLAGDFGRGLAFDSGGNLYLGRPGRHDIMVFTPGLPGWQKANLDGFSDPCNTGIWSMETFAGQLYAATICDTGAQVWRTSDGSSWNQFAAPWSISTTVGIDLQPFGSYLYLGTDGNGGAQIWRTDGINWGLTASEGFGNPDNASVIAMVVFSDTLYAATQNDISGLEVWRSPTGNTGSWSKVHSAGADVTGFGALALMDVFQGHLYLGIHRGDLSAGSAIAELWRTQDGTTWAPIFTDGLGNPNNHSLTAMAEFKGNFYIGFRNIVDGGQVWRSANGMDWVNVVSAGAGNPDNGRAYGLIVYANRLYLVFSNINTGAEVWQTGDGITWRKIASGGWGDFFNRFFNRNADYVDKGAAVFDHRLYIGTINNATGGQVWRYNVYQPFFLPILFND
jgi:sugar lactone lactonase YvrE